METEELVGQLHPSVHNYYLNTIKKLMKASFVGWVTDNKGKYLKIIVDKKTIPLPFEGGDVISEEAYLGLINNIIKIANNGREQIQEPVQLSSEE